MVRQRARRRNDAAGRLPAKLGRDPGGTAILDGIDTPLTAFLNGLGFLGDTHRERIELAAQTWADLANVRFDFVQPGETADIYVYGLNFANAYGPAFASAGGISSGPNYDYGTRIAINTTNGWPSMEPGALDGFLTPVHEIGHALGLSHPGPYDGGGNFTGYNWDAEYVEDTRMYSVMSYFSSTITGADYAGLDTEFVTPGTHDAYVIQQLYGANWETRAFDTTYGYNASGVTPFYDFDNNGGVPLVITIWDGGGEDWLDLSGDASGVTLDLRPGAFSSTHGMTYNISLAYVPEDAPDELAGYIENARGGAGNDLLTGNDRDNVLIGNNGNDTLIGLDGDDELRGGGGNDRLEGGGGTDWLDGGGGTDTADYTYSSGNWTIGLAADLDDHGGVGIWGTATAGGGVETLLDIENVVMGSGDDHVTGSSRDNDLTGNGGDDTLTGLDGDDRLEGGDGDDTLDGGSGRDWLFGLAGNDALTGGIGSDYLYGGTGNDTIWGNDGYDLIYGQGGNDTIEGGDDGDTIDGGDGNDVISGGLGFDDLDGGAGSDMLDFTYSNGDWTISLTFETASAGGDVESVRNFENVVMGGGDDTVRGTSTANYMYGGGGNNSLAGLAGNDWLEGQGGDDLLNGGSGNDFLFGGSGNDTASYHDEFSGVLVDLGLAVVQNTVGSGNDLLQSIENLIGSTHDDWLIGNGVDNQLHGGLGADQMFGGEGADILLGENGNDNLFGGDGNDLLSGGSGIDWASYLFQSSGVWINLTTENSQNTSGAGWDTLISIENVAGSNHADLLIGNGAANRLEGWGGNDVITAGNGTDVLFGHDGNDSLNGGLGNDVLEGGSGVDWALYNTGLGSGITIDLFSETQVAGGGGVDTLRDIENVMATGYADSLTGNNLANELRGEAGNDAIWGNGGADVINGGIGDDAIAGGTGADTMIGGSGNDHIWGGGGNDRFEFASNWGDDWVWDFQAGSDKLDLSQVGGLNNLIQLDIDDTANGALVSYGASSILLIGVAANALQDSDFIV